jgi:hypothetical protein
MPSEELDQSSILICIPVVCQILRGDLRKRIPIMYTCYIENFFEDVDDHDMTPVTEEINLVPFENTDPIVG